MSYLHKNRMAQNALKHDPADEHAWMDFPPNRDQRQREYSLQLLAAQEKAAAAAAQAHAVSNVSAIPADVLEAELARRLNEAKSPSAT